MAHKMVSDVNVKKGLNEISFFVIKSCFDSNIQCMPSFRVPKKFDRVF